MHFKERRVSLLIWFPQKRRLLQFTDHIARAWSAEPLGLWSITSSPCGNFYVRPRSLSTIVQIMMSRTAITFALWWLWCVFRLKKLDCIKTNKLEINRDHKVRPNESMQSRWLKLQAPTASCLFEGAGASWLTMTRRHQCPNDMLPQPQVFL